MYSYDGPRLPSASTTVFAVLYTLAHTRKDRREGQEKKESNA